MSVDLYNNTSFEISKVVTTNYSTSFSLAINLFNSEMRNSIAAIYAYVRFADEIVDTFHNQNKKLLLNEFRKNTFEAIQNEFSINPILNSFQFVVNNYNISFKLINDFLESMEMDISNSYYERNYYDKYIYGSAEAVGLMCLKIFCGSDTELFSKLEPSAKCLGSAFQKVNFLRDIKSDLSERGRIYIPGAAAENELDDKNKISLEIEIEDEFVKALEGIRELPKSSRLGVYTAYLYYRYLLKKIRKAKMSDLKSERVRISNFTKIVLLIKSMLTVRSLSKA